MSWKTALGLVVALVSSALTNLAYLREHDAAAALPALSMRRPLHSARLLLRDRTWMTGFGMESGGFLLYAVALWLASLALVQSIEAGGIGLLAYASARTQRRRLAGRELGGVVASSLGLLLLAISLAGGSTGGDRGSTRDILIWTGACVAAALVVVALGRTVGVGAADGIAGGLLFSVGDVSTKVLTQGGVRFGFAIPLIGGYLSGTALVQVGYQSGSALTVAGLATLFTNALPIAAGTVVFHEHVPSGGFGVVRVAAYALVVLGAVLLARRDGG